MNSKINIKKHLTYTNIFLLISGGGILLFFIIDFITSGAIYNKVILGPDSQFSDYFYHIAFATDRKNLYSISTMACFPPLSYCLYYFLWRINPYYTDAIGNTEWECYKNADNALTIFVVYNMVLIVLLLYSIQQYKKMGFKYQVLLPLILIFSYPFMATSTQRANAVALVAILLCLSFYWKSDDSRLKREIAMILIAVGAGFKVYPAILGLQYLKEQKLKEAFRLIIYGTLLFFVPFIFFGGVDGFLALSRTFLHLGSGTGNLGTVRGMTGYLLNTYSTITSGTVLIISRIMELLFLICSLVCFFLTKERWKEILFLSGILAVFIPSSWPYTSVYFLPALLEFITSKDIPLEKNFFTISTTILFSCIFTLPFYFINLPEGVTEGVFLSIFALLILNMAETLFKVISQIFN